MVCVLCIIFSSKTNKWKAIHTKVIRVSEVECVIFLLPKWSQNCVRSLNQLWSSIGIHHLLWACSGSQKWEDEITLCSYEEASLWTTGKLRQHCTCACVHTHTHTHTHISVSTTTCVAIFILVTQSCLTLWNPKDCSPPDSFVHGFLPARVLEWVAIPFSRGSFQPRDRTQFCISGQILYHLTPNPGFLPGESQGQRSLMGCRLWGHTESDTTKVTQKQQAFYFTSSLPHLQPGIQTP